MKTKIVATLGPASDDPEVLSEMIQAGVDVCRLNFSHGSHDYHKKVIETIKKCELNTGSAVAILADLQGPKIRLGDFEEASINLLPGDIITFTTHICKGTKERVYISYTCETWRDHFG